MFEGWILVRMVLGDLLGLLCLVGAICLFVVAALAVSGPAVFP